MSRVPLWTRQGVESHLARWMPEAPPLPEEQQLPGRGAPTPCFIPEVTPAPSLVLLQVVGHAARNDSLPPVGSLAPSPASSGTPASFQGAPGLMDPETEEYLDYAGCSPGAISSESSNMDRSCSSTPVGNESTSAGEWPQRPGREPLPLARLREAVLASSECFPFEAWTALSSLLPWLSRDVLPVPGSGGGASPDGARLPKAPKSQQRELGLQGPGTGSQGR